MAEKYPGTTPALRREARIHFRQVLNATLPAVRELREEKPGLASFAALHSLRSLKRPQLVIVKRLVHRRREVLRNRGEHNTEEFEYLDWVHRLLVEAGKPIQGRRSPNVPRMFSTGVIPLLKTSSTPITPERVDAAIQMSSSQESLPIDPTEARGLLRALLESRNAEELEGITERLEGVWPTPIGLESKGILPGLRHRAFLALTIRPDALMAIPQQQVGVLSRVFGVFREPENVTNVAIAHRTDNVQLKNRIRQNLKTLITRALGHKIKGAIK